MLEWTVCKNCGTILDNSQNICSNCKSNVEKVDIDYLRNYLNNLNFILKTLDIFTPYSSMEQLKNNSLEDIIQKDLFNYFSYLGWGDGKITDNELEFINLILDKNFTKEDIAKQNIDEIPVSFSCLKEIDDVAKNLDMCQVNSCNELFSCFKIFGKFFITVDDDLNEDVLKLYANYISKLESTLTNENITLKPAKLPDSDEINKQEDQHSLEEYLDELNKLVGLEKVKKDVNSLINLVRIRKLRSERGIKQPPMSLHLVFSGNPGTGKTTVARLLSKIYCEIGLLSKGHLVETDRSGLVGGFVGQTAIKTQEVIQSALGGILFIDEAYSLTSKSENDYGAEAIDTLLKAMEDHRDDLIVIVAGYPALMDKFLYSNPGLESRFNKFIYFEDYNEEELYNIFQLMSKESNLTIDEAGDNYLKEYFKKVYENRSSNFANGRAVRNLFEEVITNQANRLANKSEITDDELNTLTYEDFLVDENE